MAFFVRQIMSKNTFYFLLINRGFKINKLQAF
ncbi:hypothetical protein N476_25475 [Pseudoalteromonas luteoviolacea H33]|uniref:Uncharacterized protein n=1 Tax=Pseudoalteromonas luteoviolacea H33 TaxID=1365251 RepID=A0A167A5I0_9GAMM|nr:hypothetical protein N476_25475 [Pseudoalteromonas luteoviolacea H33]KZN79321.1 hypothetical protein N477_00540 [Pseudoalteromonas luteoviolacea H33-S]